MDNTKYRSNCTLLELKVRSAYFAEWSLSTGSNCTLLELKVDFRFGLLSVTVGSNCTLLELKEKTSVKNGYLNYRSNCTLLELKELRNKVIHILRFVVLIVPYWN